jgi:hypothetical protein
MKKSTSTSSTSTSTGTTEVQPFPQSRWHGFMARMTKAARKYTKRWKKDRSGFRVDGNAVCIVECTLYIRGNGELIGWTSPHITGLEPRSHNWVDELDLDNLDNLE